MAETLTTLDGILQNAVGAIRNQFKFKSRVFNEQILRGPMKLSTDEYNGQNYYRVPMKMDVPVSVAAGGPGNDGERVTAEMKFYPKDLYGLLDMPQRIMDNNPDIKGLTSHVADRLNDFKGQVWPWLAGQQVLLDGSGRRARIVDFTVIDPDMGVGYSRLYLAPAFVANVSPYFRDATVWLRRQMWTDVVRYVEGTTSADSGTITVAARKIVAINKGSTLCPESGQTTELHPWVTVTPAVVDDGTVAKGDYLCLYNPLGEIDGECMGMMAMFGNGFQSNSGTAYRRFGREFYGNLDRQAALHVHDPLQGYTYNLDTDFVNAGSENTAVKLEGTVMENLFGGYYDHAPEGTQVDAIVTHWKIRQAYAIAHDATHSPLFTTIPGTKDLGYSTVVYTDPHTGRQIPVIGLPSGEWHRGLLAIMPFKTIAMGDIGDAGWMPGDRGAWRYLGNITKEPLWRATYKESHLMANHYPGAMGAIFNCQEDPTFV